MNCDFYFTNEDCKKCTHCYVAALSSDCERHVYMCQLGHVIDGQLDESKKQCNLSVGEYFTSHKTYTITKTIEKK